MSDDELDAMAGQLDVILGAVGRVQGVAADDIPPTSHAVPMTNVLRPDEPLPCLTAAEALAAAPAPRTTGSGCRGSWTKNEPEA